MRRSVACLGLLACGHPAAPTPSRPGAALPENRAPAPPPAELPPPVALDDGTTCPAGPRDTVDACLAEHGFCARDVTPLDPALPDLVVVLTHGAVDCAGWYLLAASGDRWLVLRELHRERHHDPQYGPLTLTDLADDRSSGARVSTLSYSIELEPPDADPAAGQTPDVPQPEHDQLACTWPAVGFPRCE